jgi:hypothetical protein
MRRVEKRVQMGGNMCEMSSTHGGIYRVMETKFEFFEIFFRFFGGLTVKMSSFLNSNG